MPSSIKLPNGLGFRRGEARASFYLGDNAFILTIVFALVLHLVAIYLWQLVPHQHITDIPVRVLNIKLGDDGEEVQLTPENRADIEKAFSVKSNAIDKPAEKASEKTESDNKMLVDKALSQAIAENKPDNAEAPKQFIRQNNSPAALKTAGGLLGNSTASNAEMLSRYTQLISAWISKFKVFPPEAKAQGMTGEAIVRVTVDRQGNLHNPTIERSSGYALLDRAALDMVNRADPVPAVPNDVSSDELQEFLLPVNFK